MRVFVVPFFRSNPYQTLLTETPRRLGAEILPFRAYYELYRQDVRAGDVIHLHWPPHFTWAPADFMRTERFLRYLRQRVKAGVRLVWTIHNLIPHESVWRAGDLWINRRLGRLAHQLICHSELAKKQVIEQFLVPADRITVIPHGNYLGVYPNEISRAEARARLKFTPEQKVVLFLGRIRPYKGVNDLLAGFKACPARDLTLVLVGEPTHGVSRDELRQSVAEDPRIRLIDTFAPDDELQVYFNASDIVAFPYRQFLTSGAMILAMSFGKACLCYDTETARSVTDERGAVFVREASPAAWADRLAQLPEPTRLAELGQWNLALARKLDWETIGRATFDVYQGS